MWGTSATIIIGLLLAGLLNGSTKVTASPSRRHLGFLSCLLHFLLMLVIPIFPLLICVDLLVVVVVILQFQLKYLNKQTELRNETFAY